MSDDMADGEDRKFELPASANLMKAAAMGECPRCGSRTLFKSVVSFADRCTSCDLDYSRFNVGDGPAAFLTLAIGTVLAILAIMVDQWFHPPFWVHVILWVPLTIGMVLYGLRIAKGMLLIVEYQRSAREAGSLETGGTRLPPGEDQ